MSLVELQNGLALNTRKITKFTEGLSQEEALFRPYDVVNNFVWNLGHITMVRNTFIKIVSPEAKLTVYENEKELFGKDAKLQENEVYPELSFLLEYFVKRGELLNELLATVSDEQLQKEGFLQFGPNKMTNETLLWFFYNHECEHLGELKVIKNIVNRLRNA